MTTMLSRWGRGSAHVAAAAAFALAVLAGARVAVADDVESNIDLMRALCRDAAGELARFEGATRRPARVRLMPAASDEAHQFLEGVFTDVLRERGVVPSLGGAGAPSDSAVVQLRYRANVFELAYTDVYRAHLVGGRRVRRHAAVEVRASLVDPRDGTVLWTGRAERSRDDVVPASELARVQAGAFAFARPPMPSSGWGHYAEPVIVSGIVVGLVYLFFSNQDSNGSQ